MQKKVFKDFVEDLLFLEKPFDDFSIFLSDSTKLVSLPHIVDWSGSIGDPRGRGGRSFLHEKFKQSLVHRKGRGIDCDFFHIHRKNVDKARGLHPLRRAMTGAE